jgi:hypothetical protein
VNDTRVRFGENGREEGEESDELDRIPALRLKLFLEAAREANIISKGGKG